MVRVHAWVWSMTISLSPSSYKAKRDLSKRATTKVDEEEEEDHAAVGGPPR